MLHFRKTVCTVTTGVVLTAIACAAQTTKTEPALKADPQIAAALKQISAQRIQANIEKLVSFGTRLTLSAQDPASITAGRGIGAAREWIKSEFERYSKDCGGCLEVKTDSLHGRACRSNSEGDRNHQCLCGFEGHRRDEFKAHRAGDGALRFAEQRHLRRKWRCSRSER